jgi:hypothetical protein
MKTLTIINWCRSIDGNVRLVSSDHGEKIVDLDGYELMFSQFEDTAFAMSYEWAEELELDEVVTPDGRRLAIRAVETLATVDTPAADVDTDEEPQFTANQLMRARDIIAVDPKVMNCQFSVGLDDVWFWTTDDPGEEGEDYDWESHGLTDATMRQLAEIGLEPMWNDCPGYFNEACLGVVWKR